MLLTDGEITFRVTQEVVLSHAGNYYVVELLCQLHRLQFGHYLDCYAATLRNNLHLVCLSNQMPEYIFQLVP